MIHVNYGDKKFAEVGRWHEHWKRQPKVHGMHYDAAWQGWTVQWTDYNPGHDDMFGFRVCPPDYRKADEFQFRVGTEGFRCFEMLRRGPTPVHPLNLSAYLDMPDGFGQAMRYAYREAMAKQDATRTTPPTDGNCPEQP